MKSRKSLRNFNQKKSLIRKKKIKHSKRKYRNLSQKKNKHLKKHKTIKRKYRKLRGGASKNDVLIDTMCSNLDEDEIKNTKIHTLVKGMCENQKNKTQIQIKESSDTNDLLTNNFIIKMAKKAGSVVTFPLRIAVGTMTKVLGLSNNQTQQNDSRLEEIKKIQEEIKNNQELISKVNSPKNNN